jgi:hypothetical protein
VSYHHKPKSPLVNRLRLASEHWLGSIAVEAADEIESLLFKLDAYEKRIHEQNAMIEGGRENYRLSFALNALRDARKELETTTWECEDCGKSSPMSDIDLYDQLEIALAGLVVEKPVQKCAEEPQSPDELEQRCVEVFEAWEDRYGLDVRANQEQLKELIRALLLARDRACQ